MILYVCYVLKPTKTECAELEPVNQVFM